jgi:hypothetical protein
MTLTDALAARLMADEDSVRSTDEARRWAAAILRDPAVREALTSALAEATVASRNHLNWQIMPARKRAGIIVDYLLAEADHA